MQDFDWNDLKFVLAVHRAGTLAGAGRASGANETTVARRVRGLEDRLGARLFEPGAGRHVATDLGRAFIERAERMEDESLALIEAAGIACDSQSGTVRITSVAAIINRVLVPNLAGFTAIWPGLRVDLLPDPRNLSLGRREADLALRLARPESGGLKTIARKIGELSFAAYAPAHAVDGDAATLGWIGYDDAQSGLPQARWIDAAVRQREARSAPVRVSDVETALEATATGLGKTLLPRVIADGDPRLAPIPNVERDGMPRREVWLLYHAGDDRRRSVAAAKEWLCSLPW